MEDLKKVKPETYNPIGDSKKVKIYPTFRLGSEDLPDLKDMEVGKTYRIELEVEVMSKSQGSEWDQNSSNSKDIKSTLKVMKVGCCEDPAEDKGEDVSMMNGKEFEKEYAKRRSKA